MHEENVLNWERLLTILLGLVIAASIYIIMERRRRAKRKRLEEEAMSHKSHSEKQTSQLEDEE